MIAATASRAPRLRRKRNSAMRHGPADRESAEGARTTGKTRTAMSVAARSQATSEPRSSDTAKARIRDGGQHVRGEAAENHHGAADDDAGGHEVIVALEDGRDGDQSHSDRKSTRLNSSHL